MILRTPLSRLTLPLLLLLTLSFTACGVAKDRARLKGKLTGINNAEFYAYSEDGSFEGMDTIHIEDGKFVYERKLTQPALLTLLYPNFTQTYIVLEPGKTVKMKGDASKIGEAEITGTAQNELLTEFHQTVAAKPASDRRLAAAQFVENQSHTLAAVAVFREYFTQSSNDAAATKTALNLLNALKKTQPKERAVNFLDNFYRPIFTNGIGQPLPAFEAEDLDGKKINSAQYAGRNLAIACVGTWQSESFRFMKDLRKKLRAARGDWACIVISLDVDKAVLRDRLKQDSINYPVICDRQAFQSPLVAKLGLRDVPSCMLVGKDGKIKQRDIKRVEELQID